LVNRSGKVTVVVTGETAKAILDSPGYGGAPNPNHEVNVNYARIQQAGDPTVHTVLRWWDWARPEEMW
jgi:hypothetical protein